MTETDFRSSPQTLRWLNYCVGMAGGNEPAAKLMGVTPQRVSQWRRGPSAPSVEQMRRLCDFIRDQGLWLEMAGAGPHDGRTGDTKEEQIAALELDLHNITQIAQGALRGRDGRQISRAFALADRELDDEGDTE